MASANATNNHDNLIAPIAINVRQHHLLNEAIPLVYDAGDKKGRIIAGLGILCGIEPHAKTADGARLKISLGNNCCYVRRKLYLLDKSV